MDCLGKIWSKYSSFRICRCRDAVLPTWLLVSFSCQSGLFSEHLPQSHLIILHPAVQPNPHSCLITNIIHTHPVSPARQLTLSQIDVIFLLSVREKFATVLNSGHLNHCACMHGRCAWASAVSMEMRWVHVDSDGTCTTSKKKLKKVFLPIGHDGT